MNTYYIDDEKLMNSYFYKELSFSKRTFGEIGGRITG